MFGEFTATLIKCANFEEMRAFYRDRLGLRTVKEGENWITLDSGGGREIVLGGDTGGDTMALAFTGADLARAREALAPVDPSEIEQHDAMHRFFVRDPDGNTVLIID
ncbi:VOC family protein [Kitasatospora sp. NPDC094011]|uniref:VOC family protein n=1 Tax=Kitasatospora sp. NPDC094011 TaxID=3364090 RepID=UPI0037F70E29